MRLFHHAELYNMLILELKSQQLFRNRITRDIIVNICLLRSKGKQQIVTLGKSFQKNKSCEQKQ